MAHASGNIDQRYNCGLREIWGRLFGDTKVSSKEWQIDTGQSTVHFFLAANLVAAAIDKLGV